MVIDVKKLEKAGVSVRIFERGKGGEAVPVTDVHDPFVELFVERGNKLEALETAVKEAVNSKDFQHILIEGIYSRIQVFQILEAIEETGE